MGHKTRPPCTMCCHTLKLRQPSPIIQWNGSPQALKTSGPFEWSERAFNFFEGTLLRVGLNGHQRKTAILAVPELGHVPIPCGEWQCLCWQRRAREAPALTPLALTLKACDCGFHKHHSCIGAFKMCLRFPENLQDSGSRFLRLI